MSSIRERSSSLRPLVRTSVLSSTTIALAAAAGVALAERSASKSLEPSHYEATFQDPELKPGRPPEFERGLTTDIEFEEQPPVLGVVELASGPNGTVSARVVDATLGELADAVEEVLGISVQLKYSALADERATNVDIPFRSLELAVGALFAGFSHVSFMPPDGGARIVRISSTRNSAKSPRAHAELVVSPDLPAALPNLNALRSLARLEDAVTALSHGADLPLGTDLDELEEEIRIEDQMYAEERLREARTERALEALELERGSRIKADAIAELADVEDARASIALMAAAQDKALSAEVRQFALETLVNRGAGSGFTEFPIEPLLEALLEDQAFAVSSTAQRSLVSVRRQLHGAAQSGK